MAGQTREVQWLFFSNAAMGGKPIQYFLSDQRSDPHVGTVISYPGFGSLSFFFGKVKKFQYYWKANEMNSTSII